jgi:hypothetical protein
LWYAWSIDAWGVWNIPIVDKYGFAPDDARYVDWSPLNYINAIPYDRRYIAEAMLLASEWNMTPDAVMDMKIGQYREWVAIRHASTTKQPLWTPRALGEHAFLQERTRGNTPPVPNNVRRG